MDFTLETRGEEVSFSTEKTGPDEFSANVGGRRFMVRVARISDFELCLSITCGQTTRTRSVFVAPAKDGKWVASEGVSRIIRDMESIRSRPGRRKGLVDGPRPITPPMPAVVVRIPVSIGDVLNPGDPVIVVSAMKMETTLTASFPGRVEKINFGVGDKVAPGDILVDIVALEEKTDT